MQPKPLPELPASKIRGVLTDLDDTLTDESQMRAKTYDALWKLKEKGYWLVIVSGRPAGWADCLMRLWPLDAMIFENGAGLITREGSKLVTHNLARGASLAQQRGLLQGLFDELKKEIPHLKLASDQPYRLYDYAIDFVEEPPALTGPELERVLRRLGEEKRITAKLSSIHVNYWYGTHTKVTACEELLRTEGASRGISASEVVYAGDSPNDEPLFEYFEHAVGVANVRHFLSRMKHPPKYLTSAAGGEGFQQLVRRLTG